MGISASAVKYGFDVDAAVVLRDITDGAETSTATETAVSLGLLDHAYWHNNEVPHGTIAIGVHVTACDDGDADETYSIELLVDDVVGLNDTPTVVGTLAVPRGTTGFFTMLVDSRTIENLVSDNSGTDLWMGIRATLAGTSPSLTYGAWIAKSLR